MGIVFSSRRSPRALVAALVVLLGVATVARADSVIVGGSSLLTMGDANQLAGWLGEGDLTLTNVFSHTTGDGKTSLDFHAAADGMGRTFSVIQVLSINGAATNQVIGGYNPQSWRTGFWNITTDVADRTAFLFNLTSDEIQRQRLDSNGGQYQTYNSYGPTFGGGHDLYVRGNDLAGGYTFQQSYGGNDGPSRRSDGTYEGGRTILGMSSSQNLTFGTLEVYTIANGGVDPVAPVPLPAAVWSGIALFGLIGAKRLRRKGADA